ncbi:MAG: hypothetical protein WAQ53_07745 [Thiofilum sp.]|uniref:hypothetical protein n=1 Tax=Thiofilum sp. TaxID=2212733 RepID=UPI0025CD6E05|nr:hypothetical protein [Thiofilum sp.]MBK8453380.1 hypothetical protein [Thiofilum sp.]
MNDAQYIIQFEAAFFIFIAILPEIILENSLLAVKITAYQQNTPKIKGIFWAELC